MTVTEARAVTLAAPGDPFSVTGQTITSTRSASGSPTGVTTRVFAAGPPATWTTTSPAGRQLRATLDALERVTEVAVLGSDPVALFPIQYRYDERGRLDQVTRGGRVYATSYDPLSGWVASTSDPAGLGVTYTSRDGNGRPLSITLPGGRALSMSYDPSGNVLSVTPPSKPAHAFSWDPASRPSAYAPPDLGFTPKDTTYAHDHDGLLLSLAQPGTPATFAYDALGRLHQAVGAVTKSYAYDAQGRLASITTSDGVTLTYAYDGLLLARHAVSGPFSHAVNKTHDNFLRVSSWNIDGVNPVARSYDGDNLVTAAGGMTLSWGTTGLLKTTAVGGLTDSFTYNAHGELIGHTVTGSATSYAATYTRDAAGRIDTKAETLGGTARSERYTYDDAGRLWQVFVDGAFTPAHEYAYDPNGNRDDGTHDDQDRLLTYGGFSVAYGPDGTLAKKTDDVTLAETLYAYDTNGSLRAVTRPAPLAPIEYVIDGNNRRIGKKVGGSLVQGFFYDGARVVAELDATGAVVARFVYATDGHSPDLMLKGGATYRFVKDHLGGPRLVVDVATGAVAQRLDFDPWGVVILDTNSGFQPFGFAGGLWDRDTNLVRFGARDYDPTTGRWTSKDLSRFGGGLNFYAYANLDPVNYIDVDGHHPFLVALGLAAFVLGYGSLLASDDAHIQAETHPEMHNNPALGIAGSVGMIAPLGGVGAMCGGVTGGATSRVLHASQIGELGSQEGTVVLGHYTRPLMGGVQETLPILENAAGQLGGRTLSSLPPDMSAIAPELGAASRIVFYTSSNMQGLTAAEMSLIQSNPSLLAKTTFVYGGF